MMNKRLFGISDPFKHAEKLDREYKRLSRSDDVKNKEDQVDHALNFSFAAWHLADKVWNHSDTQRALIAKGIEGWKVYRDRIFRLCPGLKVCYDLSIEYKHSNHSPSETVTSATQIPKRGIARVNGIPITRIASVNGIRASRIASVSGISISAGPKLIVTTADGTELDFMDTARAVNAFWQEELDSLRT